MNNIRNIIKEKLRESFGSGLLKEHISNHVIYLKNYLSMSEEQKKSYLVEQYWYLFDDFLNDTNTEFEPPKELRSSDYDDEPDEEVDMFDNDYDMVEWLSRNNKELYDKFADYLYENIINHTLNNNQVADSDYPAWSYFYGKPEIIKNQWLVHLTDNANDIYRDGFKFGVGEIDKLHLTTHLSRFDKKYGGYNFAYTPWDFSRYAMDGRRGEYKYGSEAVVFRASGVRVWHSGDEEYQTIFYGGTARDIVPITSGEDKDYAVYGKNDKILFEDNDLERVIDWVIDNYDQYRKQLNVMPYKTKRK